MPPTPSIVCRAKASYKKTPGFLELTDTHLQWTSSGKAAPDVRIPNSKAISLFCSKEGSAQVKLKLALVGDDAGHTFMFTSAQATAEREAFKRELTIIIGANRASGVSTPTSQAPAATSVSASVAQTGLKPLTPMSAPSVSRATSVTSDRAASGTPSGPVEDFRIRKKVLVRNPELASLHKELVMTGQLTEGEFWEGREYLLLAEAAQQSQKRGRPGQIVDPRPEATEGGDTKIIVTPQIIRDIFEEYPVVARAYSETVPTQLKESEFWERYFQSKLYHLHRASIRSSATQHVVKDDPIFDKYVEKADDELEPRRQREDNLDIFVNLYATQEDHVESGNQKDVSMQAGRHRGALPLIRKFNEHSERLLNAAEGSSDKRRRLSNDPESAYAHIDLEDLHDFQSSIGIALEMKDRDRYFDGRTTAIQGAGDEEQRPTLATVLPHVLSQLDDWNTEICTLRFDKKASDAALNAMTQNVQTRLEVKLRKGDIPEHIYSQMRSCQTAANEFLRQFWNSIYPQASEAQVVSSASATQRAAKATKMAGYLAKTPEKVESIVRMAQKEGIDPTKVEVALKPVLTATEKALQFHKSRKSLR